MPTQLKCLSTPPPCDRVWCILTWESVIPVQGLSCAEFPSSPWTCPHFVCSQLSLISSGAWPDRDLQAPFPLWRTALKIWHCRLQIWTPCCIGAGMWTLSCMRADLFLQLSAAPSTAVRTSALLWSFEAGPADRWTKLHLWGCVWCRYPVEERTFLQKCWHSCPTDMVQQRPHKKIILRHLTQTALGFNTIFLQNKLACSLPYPPGIVIIA